MKIPEPPRTLSPVRTLGVATRTDSDTSDSEAEARHVGPTDHRVAGVPDLLHDLASGGRSRPKAPAMPDLRHRPQRKLNPAGCRSSVRTRRYRSRWEQPGERLRCRQHHDNASGKRLVDRLVGRRGERPDNSRRRCSAPRTVSSDSPWAFMAAWRALSTPLRECRTKCSRTARGAVCCQ